MDHVDDFLLPNLDVTKSQYHLIVLNSPCVASDLIRRLWRNCIIKICADGGANRLFSALSDQEKDQFIPNFITGDLDSLQSHVRDYYRYFIFFAFSTSKHLTCNVYTSSLNVPIIQDPDQDSHDLDKSLKLLKESISSDQVAMTSKVVVIGGTGGRIDQQIAVFNTLYSWSNSFQKILIVDDESIAYLLQSNVEHKISPIRQEDIYQGRYCGLLPLGNPVRSIRTTGLVWNLNNEPLEFGKRISTSNSIANSDNNEVDSTFVTIYSTDPILWTTTWKI